MEMVEILVALGAQVELMDQQAQGEQHLAPHIQVEPQDRAVLAVELGKQSMDTV
jgi:hypothetical protein